MFKLITQWEAVQNKTTPQEPGCWQEVSKDVQNILIHAIDADYSKRKSAHELLDLFRKLCIENVYNKFVQHSIQIKPNTV